MASFKIKYKNWFINKSLTMEKIHMEKKYRQRFTRKYKLMSFLFFLLLLGCSVLMCFAGLKFNPDGSGDNTPNTNWYIDSSLDYGSWYFIVGISIFLLIIIISSFLGILIPKLYKQSKAFYLQSKYYQDKVSEYSQIDLTNKRIKEIKWMYKLFLITKVTFTYYKQLNKKQKNTKK